MYNVKIVVGILYITVTTYDLFKVINSLRKNAGFGNLTLTVVSSAMEMLSVYYVDVLLLVRGPISLFVFH